MRKSLRFRARRPAASSRRMMAAGALDMDAMRERLRWRAEETLDPDDWADVQALSHRIVDDAVGYLRDVRNRPVWQEMPARCEGISSRRPCRDRPRRLADIYGEVADNVMPYPMGNIHPRFWSWYMGSSNFTGALGDFLAAIQGSNLGGGNHAAALMDQQVVDWCKEMMGFPAIGQRHAGQRRVDGQHHRPDRGAQYQGGHRRARARRCRHREAFALLWLGSDSQLPPQGDGGARARTTGRCGAFRPMPNCASTSRHCGRRSPRIARRDISRPA